MANTTLTKDVGRQRVLSAMIPIVFGNVADTATAVNAVDLPYGAVVTGGYFVVDTVFNVGTTSTLDIGDSTSANRYANDINLKALGVTALTLTGYTSDGAAIQITPANVGTVATTGAGRLYVEYVITGRAAEVQPN